MMIMPVAQDIVVRDAYGSDIPAVQSIYTHEVLNGVATFEEIPPSAGELLSRREAVLSLGLPYLVATVGNTIVGYCYATGYRARPAYRHSIESSVYVVPKHQKTGVGRKLLATLIARCEQGPFRQMIAIVGDSEKEGSIALHTALGFRYVGGLAGSGFKHGRWVDTVLMQRALGDGTKTLPSGSHSS